MSDPHYNPPVSALKSQLNLFLFLFFLRHLDLLEVFDLVYPRAQRCESQERLPKQVSETPKAY